MSQAARLGGTASEATDWVSATSLRCALVMSSGHTLRVAVTAGERVGATLTEALSYDAPQVNQCVCVCLFVCVCVCVCVLVADGGWYLAVMP